MFSDYILNAYTVTVAAILATFGFLIRKIFTSEKKLEILEVRLAGFEDVEQDIRELRADVKDILFQMSLRTVR